MYSIITLIGIYFTILLLFNACAPSSSSIRYGHSEVLIKEDKDSTVRFISKDDIIMDSLTATTDIDCCGDDVSELEDPSDLPDEDVAFDLSEILKRMNSEKNDNSLSSDQSNHRERVLMEIIKYMNTPYKFGGNSISGIDCSAFTQTVFRDALSIPIYRSAREQYTQGETIDEKNELKFGDLVFFNTRRRVRPGHVGIYIGENLFAHASTKLGVTISSLDHNYYSARYMGARRIDSNGIF
ncbi:MAG TPA: C40 family peptidase [Ignavibacteriaceae bacterium]|nr:C40 family peptidase [Ignavibacteriaceae bacterium]